MEKLKCQSIKKMKLIYSLILTYVIVKAWDLWTRDRALELIDPVLLEDASKDTLVRYVNVALLCVQERAEDRPTILDVVAMLSNEAAPLLLPKQPAFSYLGNMVISTSPADRPKSCSVNEVTVSLLQAR